MRRFSAEFSAEASNITAINAEKEGIIIRKRHEIVQKFELPAYRLTVRQEIGELLPQRCPVRQFTGRVVGWDHVPAYGR